MGIPVHSTFPGEFRIVFCSGKDRKPISGFVHVINTGTFNAVVGWNTHVLTTPFYWDGVSNLLINTCSYSSAGYTTNSVFNQTATTYLSTVFSFQDGGEGACYRWIWHSGLSATQHDTQWRPWLGQEQFKIPALNILLLMAIGIGEPEIRC